MRCIHMVAMRMDSTGPKRRTTINLDVGLVDRARQLLGTRNTTDTVHEALEEIIRRAALRRLAAREFDLSLEELKEMRKGRHFESLD